MTDRGASLFWPEERWRALQVRQFAAHLRTIRHAPLYRGMPIPPECELSVESLPSVLGALPLTTKEQLAAAGPAAWAVAPNRVAEWVCTSGTTGRPLDVPLTQGDLERLAENEAAALELAGIRAGDLVILAVGMERLFVAGLAYWLGARRVGAACVRVGPQLAAQAGHLPDLVRRFDPRPIGGRIHVIAVPSFLLQAERSPVNAPLAGVIAIGEPIRDTSPGSNYNVLGHRLHEQLGCPIMSTYASTETCTSFAEGPLCRGGHLNPGLAILECVDEAGNDVPEDTVGELVITPLGVEGLPLIRFRTGDMAAIDRRACPCGRATPRIGPIVGRRGQLLKFKGTSVYPGAIIELLRAHPAIADCLVVATQEHALSDNITVYIEARPEACEGVGSGLGPRGAITSRIESALRGLLRATPEIRYVSAGQLKEMQVATGSRKLARFIDRRGTPGSGA